MIPATAAISRSPRQNHEAARSQPLWVDACFWWSPKSGYTSGTVTDVSNGAPTANRRIDVMESGTLNHFCDTNTPGRVTFPIAPTSKYAIIVYVINPNTPPDSAGETLSICVNGLQ